MDFSVEEIRAETKHQLSKLGTGINHWRFGGKAQLSFLEDLYLLINDGIPANRAIEMMAQVTTGVSREVALSLVDSISKGKPLAEGMKEWFTPNIVEIIRVGEAGGALAQTMKSSINMLAQKGSSMGAFIGAVSYPFVVIIMGCVMTLYLQKSVFTQFAQIKPMEQWPSEGQQLMALANFIKSYWWLTIITVILMVIGLKKAMANYVGELRPFLDNYPPFSFYRKLAAARLLETLGLLVSNGVVFKSALKVMQYQANPYIGSHLAQMESLLGKGKSNIADVLDTGLVDKQDLTRLRVMAEVKGFEHGLVRMGVRGTEAAIATLKIISKALGGLFLIIGGIMILMIVRGMFMTGMSMGN
jgi:type II secretory pathway component PulF